MPSVQSLTVGTADQIGTATCSVTVTAADNLVAVCAVHCEDALAVVDPPVLGGLETFTQAPDGEEAAGTWSHIEFWFLINPSVGTNTVSVPVSGPGADRARIAVWIIEDADQTAPLRTCYTQWSDASNAVSGSVPSVESTDLLLDALTIDSTVSTPTVGANQLNRYENSNGVSASFQMMGSEQEGVDGTVMSWTWTGTAHPNSYLATAVKAAPSGDPPQQLRPDADIATTGWSTAPLWSKIEESAADGTTITGVAS